jgi:clan AA aspartic protease
MNGVVVGLQARMNVSIRLAEDFAISIECVVDTGFEGFLTLPIAAIEKLGLTYAGRINANLADSSNVSTEVYWATILWNGTEREIAVIGMGTRPLIGTALLNEQELLIQFIDGGSVTVSEL